jgi:transglutaminase-like putative cysteine protease
MNIAIRYEATYAYEESASFSPHLVRLFPKNDRSVRTDRALFETDDGADVQYRHDIFDNEIAKCFYPEKRASLNFRLELDLALTEKNPFHFLLESHALNLPFEYLPQEAAVLAPYLDPGIPLALPDALQPFKTPRPTVEALVDMNSWIFENLGYMRREEGEAWAPAETLATGSGACRDFAVLLVDVFRKHGVAARLASGFLWEPPDVPKEDLRAESALHAWIEAYLPGAGWMGFDPTNGVLCDHHRITAAVGLTSDDISPIKGLYYGDRKIENSMTATLEIKPR